LRGKKVVFKVLESTDDPGALRENGLSRVVWGRTKPFHMRASIRRSIRRACSVQTRVTDFVADFTTIVRWGLEPREVRGIDPSGTHKLGTEP
jgi:hypothetical protein